MDNYKPLSDLRWQVHFYGRANPDLVTTAQQRGLRTVAFRFDENAAKTGLHRDSAYLLRPDGHVGLALPDQDAGALANYLSRHNLHPADH